MSQPRKYASSRRRPTNSPWTTASTLCALAGRAAGELEGEVLWRGPAFRFAGGVPSSSPRASRGTRSATEIPNLPTTSTRNLLIDPTGWDRPSRLKRGPAAAGC
jgi:hypothetical protein